MASARRDVMPYLAAMTHHCKPRGLTVEMAARYDLDEKDLSFVTGSGESTNKVEGIVADAREMREESAVSHSGGAFEGAIRNRNGDSNSDGEDDAGGVEDGDSGDGADGNEPTTTETDVGATDNRTERGETSTDSIDDGSVADGQKGDASGEAAESAGSDDSQSGLSDFY